MNINTPSICCAALAVVLLAPPCLRAANAGTNAPNPTATNANPEAAMTALFGDPVIARGKGVEIKRSQLDELYSSAKATAAASGRMLPPYYEAQILDQLLFVQLMQQKATDADRADGKKEADLQFTNTLRHFASEEALAQQLKAVGLTLNDYRTRVAQEATARAVFEREVKVNVPEAEVTAYYSNHPAAFEQPEKARLDSILLFTVDTTSSPPAPLSADQVQAKRKTINDLLKRANAGESFTNLAARYSEDPNAKVSNGELPPLSRDQMAPELAAAAFSLTNNQVSDVIELPVGFYLLKLMEKVPAQKLALGDMTPAGDQTVAASVKAFLTQQKLNQQLPAYVQNLKKAANVEILDPNLKAEDAALEAATTNAPAAGDF
ncbi:MAG: peptidylprolyl isomerase [Verrucomicrobiota bacterium]|jgi:parvulin-like peptidyl-prolyl isomerase